MKPAMPRGPDHSTARERHLRRSAWAASIFVLGLLLFTWPFVRSPALDIGASYAHLLGAWAAIVVALASLSRAIGRTRSRGHRA